MKAYLQNDSQIINLDSVKTVQIVCVNGDYLVKFADCIGNAINCEERFPTYEEAEAYLYGFLDYITQEEYQKERREVATAIMQGMLSDGASIGVAQRAVKLADELLNELAKEQ